MRVRFQNKTLFEIETEGDNKYLIKENQKASRLAGRKIYIKVPLTEIINSDKEVINLK